MSDNTANLLRRPFASQYLLLASSAFLLMIGLVMVLSASSIDAFVASGNAFTVFLDQALWAVIGLIAFWIAQMLRPAWYRWLAVPLLLITILLLSILWIRPDLGVGVHGRWLDLGVVQMQPSEVAKLALILWGADILVRKQRLLGEWRQLAVPLIPIAGIVLLLVGVNDLGTMMSLVLIVLALLWVSGVRFRVLISLAVVTVGAAAMLTLSRSYRVDRVTAFLNPFADPDDTGYHSVQSLYALSTGGWWGVGLGHSRSKWERLPEAHNDFIFAIIGEELGVVGCIVVIALYAVFAYAGIRVAKRVTDLYIRLVTAACVMWLSGQAFINMGQVLGLMPVTGIPLPLISAGGTSLVLTMFTVGMMVSFSRHEPQAARILNDQGRNRMMRLLLIPTPTPSQETEQARQKRRKASSAPRPRPSKKKKEGASSRADS